MRIGSKNIRYLLTSLKLSRNSRHQTEYVSFKQWHWLPDITLVYFTSDFVCTENQLISNPLSNFSAVSDYDIYRTAIEMTASQFRDTK
jgi:hypothetical protein